MPENFLLFLITAAVSSIIPGLSVIGAFFTSLNYGSRAGVIFSLGLVTCSLFYFILGAIGLVFLVQKYNFFLDILKYGGALYLSYLGFDSIINSKKEIALKNEVINNSQLSGLFLTGFMIHLVNPKNILFFAVILPPYLDVSLSLSEQILWLSLGSTIPEFIILLIYIYFAQKIKFYLINIKFMKLFNILIGSIFIGLAASIVFLF